MSRGLPICYYCSRLQFPEDTPFCEAFPERIPDVIWFDGGDHRRKLDDEPVVFEAKDSSSAADVRAIWGRTKKKPEAQEIPGSTEI